MSFCLCEHECSSRDTCLFHVPLTEGKRAILRKVTEGHVIIIGGAEDKVRERVILTRFIKLAGGADARIAVISTASSLGPLAGEMYRRVFGELGAAEVHPIHTVTRTQANDPA